MIQIAFQPALDPYHTVFRLLRLMHTVKLAGRLECDQVRILDFYLAFPFRVGDIRTKPEHRRFKRIGRLYEDMKPYGDMPEDYIIFDRMRPIQLTAFQHMAACDLISPLHLNEGWIVSTESAPPDELSERVLEKNREDDELMGFLSLLTLDYPLSGIGGLKDRTHLLEHRYDAA